MKRIIALSVIAVAIIFSMANASATPSAAVRSYLSALQRDDASGLSNYATQETVAFAMSAPGIMLRAIMAEMGAPQIVGERINGDNAVVIVRFEYEDDTLDFKVIRRNGTWLVDDVPRGK